MSGESSRTSCLICNEKFPNSKKVDLHIKVVHLKMFICSKCPNFSTMIKMRMTQHNRKSHGGDKVAAKRRSDGKAVSAAGDSPTKKARSCSDDFDADSEHAMMKPRFECEECWFAAETQEKLDGHVKEKHGADAGDGDAAAAAEDQEVEADSSLESQLELEDQPNCVGPPAPEASATTTGSESNQVQAGQENNEADEIVAESQIRPSATSERKSSSEKLAADAASQETPIDQGNQSKEDKLGGEPMSQPDNAVKVPTGSAATEEPGISSGALGDLKSSSADLPKVERNKLKLFESLDQAIKGIELQIKSAVKPPEVIGSGLDPTEIAV